VLSYCLADFTFVVVSRRAIEGWIQVGGADLKVMTWILDQQLGQVLVVVIKVKTLPWKCRIGRKA
jgi:hypothetical protein